MPWEPRTYRDRADAAGLVTFEVVYAETDLQISASSDLRDEAMRLVSDIRGQLDAYARAHPRFTESYVPVEVEAGASDVARAMADAAEAAGVGPMAAVAGAVAEAVARGLAPLSPEVVVENGGDIYLMGTGRRRVLLLAGDSPLSGKVGIVLEGDDLPCAVCTSSGKVGPSVSLGVAHSVTIVAQSGAIADAAATAAGNLVHGPSDIERALSRALEVPGVRGAVVIAGERIGALGSVRLERI